MNFVDLHSWKSRVEMFFQAFLEDCKIEEVDETYQCTFICETKFDSLEVTCKLSIEDSVNLSRTLQFDSESDFQYFFELLSDFKSIIHQHQLNYL